MKSLIGMIGVGSMGGPIAANLPALGLPMVVCDTDAAALRPLQAAARNSRPPRATSQTVLKR